MSDVDDKTGPLWGRLGIEQYLITKWDHSSIEPPDQQRKRLVSRFLNIPLEPKQDWEGETGGTHLRKPTAEETDAILRPYRCEKLRWHACNIYMDKVCPMLLRTHYAKNEDEKKRHDKMMEEWIDVNQFCEEAWWAVLDDVNLFDFGSEWRRIYDVLPEIAYPVYYREVEEGDQNILWDNYVEPRDQVEMRVHFKRAIAAAKQNDPEAWRNDRKAVIESIDTLQREAAYTYIVIADEKAFQSGWLRVIYLDGLQRTIREGRIEPDYHDIGTVAGLWENACEILGSEFTTLDEKYQINGEIGKELYQLTEEDLADP